MPAASSVLKISSKERRSQNERIGEIRKIYQGGGCARQVKEEYSYIIKTMIELGYHVEYDLITQNET